jgi:hypothetical protein
MYLYNAVYSENIPVLNADWYAPLWNTAETAELISIRPESSSHIPGTRFKMLYNNKGLSGIFTVDDKYISCKAVEDMDSVWLDSCVEFFVMPHGSEGYFNFEFSCTGFLYASYVRDCTRTENGFKDFVKLTKDDCASVKRSSSVKNGASIAEGEAFEWSLQFFIPIELLEKYCGKADLKTVGWKCNFYKCADNSSHPHWISWAPLKELNFHAPDDFGKLAFII